MPNKLLVKLTTCTTYLTISIVLILSLVASLITHPQPAHATTLPAYRYTKTFDTSATNAYAYGIAVATDSSGNVYVTGQFQGKVGFGAGGSNSQTTANISSFLTKYNANGTYAYTKIFD